MRAWDERGAPRREAAAAGTAAAVEALTSGLNRINLAAGQHQQTHMLPQKFGRVDPGRPQQQQQSRQVRREVCIAAHQVGRLIGPKGAERRRLQSTSGVSHLYVHSAGDMPSARVEIAGSEEAVAACLQLIQGLTGAVSPELPGPGSASSDSGRSDGGGGWPGVVLPLREHQRWTRMFPYLQRRSCVRITPDRRTDQLHISAQTKGAVDAVQSALKLLAAAEAFVVVSSSENGPVDSSPCASEADVGFPITAAQADELLAELEDLPEIADYRGGTVRQMKGARERDCVTVDLGSGARRFVTLRLRRRDSESVCRVLDPLLRGKQPVEGWKRWLVGGVGWEFAKSDMAARGKWTAKLQECRDMLVAANKMAGGDKLQGLLYYRDPATGGMVQRLRGSGARYEEVITDVRKFLEFLIFSAAYRKKSGLPGNDYMWDTIERICLRSSLPHVKAFNGGLMRTSNRGPDVPVQWSAHAHESTYGFVLVTEASQSELIQGVQAISRLLIEEAAGLRYRDVLQQLADSKDGHALDHLKSGDLVEVSSGKLKGRLYVFVGWTTPQQLSAKLREEGEGGEMLGRSVNRSQLAFVSSGAPPEVEAVDFVPVDDDAYD
eukprot:jgi/Tetstr1/434477/TSEL_023569.t1